MEKIQINWNKTTTAATAQKYNKKEKKIEIFISEICEVWIILVFSFSLLV